MSPGNKTCRSLSHGQAGASALTVAPPSKRRYASDRASAWSSAGWSADAGTAFVDIRKHCVHAGTLWPSGYELSTSTDQRKSPTRPGEFQLSKDDSMCPTCRFQRRRIWSMTALGQGKELFGYSTVGVPKDIQRVSLAARASPVTEGSLINCVLTHFKHASCSRPRSYAALRLRFSRFLNLLSAC